MSHDSTGVDPHSQCHHGVAGANLDGEFVPLVLYDDVYQHAHE